MEQLDRACIVLELAEDLKKNGSWTGETHVQKAVYFLQDLLHVPTDFEFLFYKHGPFSFELRDALTYMQAEDFIGWVAQPPYGPSLRSGELASELKQQFGASAALYRRQVEFISGQLGRKTVAELERIATALWVIRRENEKETDVARRITFLKPHITPEQAEAAVRELRSVRERAERDKVIQQTGA